MKSGNGEGPHAKAEEEGIGRKKEKRNRWGERSFSPKLNNGKDNYEQQQEQ
jgi:hypothetical protein